MTTRQYFEGVPVYTTNFGAIKNGAALCLPGIGIFVNKSSLKDLDLLRHEFGHILQSRKFSLLFFYLVIGPASLFTAAFKPQNHRNNWIERQANRYSFEYFGAPLDWPMQRFPILESSQSRAYASVSDRGN